MDERDLPTADRVVRLLRQLGIDRAHVVQGVAEVAGHPEMVASLALVTPAAGAASPLRQLVAPRRVAGPPLIIHSDGGPLSAQSALVLAADPDANGGRPVRAGERALDRHCRRSHRRDHCRTC